MSIYTNCNVFIRSINISFTHTYFNSTNFNIFLSPRNSTIRDLPDFDDAVLGATGDDVVIVRTPGNVQHRTFVSTDQWVIWVYSANLQTHKTTSLFHLNFQ